MENLENFFEGRQGTGVLSTADSEGRVNGAIFAKPHVLAEDTVSFIMRENLTYSNLQSNPHAAYVFRTDGRGYEGVRLHLSKLRENDDQAHFDSVTRVSYSDDAEVRRILVTFRVDKRLPLVGAA